MEWGQKGEMLKVAKGATLVTTGQWPTQLPPNQHGQGLTNTGPNMCVSLLPLLYWYLTLDTKPSSTCMSLYPSPKALSSELAPYKIHFKHHHPSISVIQWHLSMYFSDMYSLRHMYSATFSMSI